MPNKRLEFSAVDVKGNCYLIREVTGAEMRRRGFDKAVDFDKYLMTTTNLFVTQVSKGHYQIQTPTGDYIEVTSDDPNAP